MSIAEKLATIAENEQRVYDAGYEKGKAEGGGGDTEAAYNQGRQDEKDEFWDNYQNNHNPTYCKFQFAGKGWNSKTFYPKYDITPKVAQSMFQELGDTREPFSLKERLEECGVVLDMSECTSWDYSFYGTCFTELPHLDTRNTSKLNFCFRISSILETISIQIRDDGSQTWNQTFSGCTSLKNLTITSGAIGGNGFSVSDSTKISQASLISILEACNKDVTASPITITLPKKCIDGATDTKALLENDKNVIEYFMPWDESYGVTQLPNTNIIKSSVVLTTYYATGEEASVKSYDDGEGNIRFQSPTGEATQGTIDYSTGLINITSYLMIAQGGQIKVEYQINTPYQNALANGYTIAYA